MASAKRRPSSHCPRPNRAESYNLCSGRQQVAAEIDLQAIPAQGLIDMSRRSRAREVVIQVLYEDDLNPDRSPEIADQFLCTRLNNDQELIDFGRSLLAGVRKHRGEIDKLLIERADNWTLERMAVTDRNILRLGAYEMLHGGTPERVAINEAVELAKRYGAKQSPLFVNGVLDRFMRKER
jgi:N utilization substance protein B